MYVHRMKLACLATILIVVGAGTIAAQEKDSLAPRVPSDKRSEAKALTSPLKVNEGIIAEGKAVYEGKGACVNCHGKSGKGDGPAGAVLKPPPRDFTDCAFQKKRMDGELFWVMKNGIPGTAMMSFVPGLVNEEEAWKVIAYVRSFCR